MIFQNISYDFEYYNITLDLLFSSETSSELCSNLLNEWIQHPQGHGKRPPMEFPDSN